MEILKQFGINPVLLVAQVINFLIILFLLKRFFYRPLLEVIKKREDVIKNGLESAEAGNTLLEKAREEEKKLLVKASEQAEKMIKNAKEESLEIKTNIEEKTNKRIEKMLSDAKIEIDRKSAETKKELSENILKVAITVLEKTLPQLLNKKEQEEILAKTAEKIGKRL